MDTQELLRLIERRLDYDRATGRLTNKPHQGVVTGKLFGTPTSTGRRQGMLGGRRYQADALVWLLETGEWPGALAHINGDPADDRFENLRPCDGVAGLIMRARERGHADYDFSRVRYVDAETPVEVGCRVHGWFTRKPSKFVRTGCPHCAQDRAAQARRTTAEAKKTRRRRYERRRRQAGRADPLHMATVTSRSLLWRTLYAADGDKRACTSEELGYSPAQLQQHIESLFDAWMTWANIGEWHIDHTVPVSWFLRWGIVEPSVINALKNLRPLRAARNLRKSNALTVNPFVLYPELRGHALGRAALALGHQVTSVA